MAGETRYTITPGLWAGLVLAPLAWFVSQQVSYSLASFCIWGRSSATPWMARMTLERPQMQKDARL